MDNNLQFNETMLQLNATLYGAVEKLSDTLSKCRVRIFYKGLNRNRTFISEDFANQLIASLPYAPVKGIFDKDDMDFEDHGEDNTDGRIYAVVASEPNFAWEKHLDIDGVEREYACADVILFTGLYPEANLIQGKGQSMEIYRNNLEYEWQIHEDGLPCVYFKKGCLLGLQILGNEHEPCFEGAAFFSLYKDIQNLIRTIDTYSKRKEEKNKMDKSLFRLSDDEKAEAIFSILNPNFTEEGNWKCDYRLLSVYDDYALTYNFANKNYERFYYTKENDTVTLGDSVVVYIVDVTASEQTALETMKAIGGTYEKSVEKITEIQGQNETLKQEKANYEIEQENLKNELTDAKEELTKAQTSYETEKIELNNKLNTIESEVTDFKQQISDLTAEKVRLLQENSDIINEKNSLADYKKSIELNQKEELLENFSNNLNESQITALREKIDTYSVEDFKKEICVTAYDNNKTIFERQDSKGLIFKGGDPNYSHSETGIERILNKYKKGGNK